MRAPFWSRPAWAALCPGRCFSRACMTLRPGISRHRTAKRSSHRGCWLLPWPCWPRVSLPKKSGPRKLAASSSLLAAAGFTLGAFVDVASLIEAAAVSSVLGASAGIVYVTTMATAMRWYPEKKGIITGAIHLRFGLCRPVLVQDRRTACQVA